MITSIKREFNLLPNIVGIVTTDTLAAITAAGYFSTQSSEVEELNNGTWYWEEEDYVLIYYSDNQVGFFTYNSTTDTFVPSSPIQSAEILLTTAQIKAMSATPVMLLPAPGVGYMNVIDSILWDVTFVTPQYTGGGATQAQYGATVLGAGPAASAVIAGATIDAIAASTILTQGAAAVNASKTAANNAAVYLSNATAPFAAGNSTAVLKIRFHVIAI